MSAVGHFVYKVGFPTVPSRQPGCLRDTGVSLTYNPRNTGGLTLKWEYKGKGTKVGRTREVEDMAEGKKEFY
jgi:hypothetical protein